MINKELKIFEVSNIDLKTSVKEMTKQLVNDLSLRVSQDELSYFIDRVTDIFKADYSEMRLASIENVNNRICSGALELRKFSVSNYLRLFFEFKRDNTTQVQKNYDENIYDDYDNASEYEKKRRYFAMVAFIYRFNRGESGKDSPSFESRLKQAEKGEIQKEDIKLDKDSIFNQSKWY